MSSESRHTLITASSSSTPRFPSVPGRTMPQGWMRAVVALTVFSQICSHPIDTDNRTQTPDSYFAKTERSWLWGWAWGAESTVSVVDHSPIVSFPSRPGIPPPSRLFIPDNHLALIAAFGAEIRDPILGYVIAVSSFTAPCSSEETTLSLVPNTGCPDLCQSGPHKPTDTWIALVQRGECEFVKKVREAQRFGAKAVVVGGEDPEVTGHPDTLVNMYSPGPPLTFHFSRTT